LTTSPIGTTPNNYPFETIGTCRHLFSVINFIISDDKTLVFTEITFFVIISEANNPLMLWWLANQRAMSRSEMIPLMDLVSSTTNTAPILYRDKTSTASSTVKFELTVKHGLWISDLVQYLYVVLVVSNLVRHHLSQPLSL
jgi:hypothetical protein